MKRHMRNIALAAALGSNAKTDGPRKKAGLIGALFLFAVFWGMVIGTPLAQAQDIRYPAYTPLIKGAESRGYALYLPSKKRRLGKVPVVMVIHGTVGIRRNSLWYRIALLRAGIGFAEVDFKSGLYTSGRDRPSAGFFQPYAYGVLRALRKFPEVDQGRIAIMGFSMGGRITLTAALERWKHKMIAEEAPFSAHVAIYPACGTLHAQKMTGKPILMIHGMDDEFAPEEYCDKLRRQIDRRAPNLVEYKTYNGVNHRFDWYPSRSRGNRWWDETAARDSRRRVVAFLQKAFGMPQGG